MARVNGPNRSTLKFNCRDCGNVMVADAGYFGLKWICPIPGHSYLLGLADGTMGWNSAHTPQIASDDEKSERFDRVIESLQFCPTCGKKLELHPATGQPACFLHGDFEVTEVQSRFRVEFKNTRW